MRWLPLLMLPAAAAAQTFPADNGFTPFLCGDLNAFDATHDQSGAVGERDIVGDQAAPAAFRAVDSQFLYLRMRLDLDPAPGSTKRVCLPHPEVFAVLKPGLPLLIDDGKLRLEVERTGDGYAIARVKVGGKLSERKGVNIPDEIIPLSPLTAKDRRDLEYGLELGADWVALSFVQRPDDIDEARALIGDRAGIMAKLEKPMAITKLDDIVAKADSITASAPS